MNLRLPGSGYLIKRRLSARCPNFVRGRRYDALVSLNYKLRSPHEYIEVTLRLKPEYLLLSEYPLTVQSVTLM